MDEHKLKELTRLLALAKQDQDLRKSVEAGFAYTPIIQDRELLIDTALEACYVEVYKTYLEEVKQDITKEPYEKGKKNCYQIIIDTIKSECKKEGTNEKKGAV